MKKIQLSFIALFLVAFIFPQLSFSQDDVPTDFGYEVNKVYPYVSISENQLDEATHLADLNGRYKSSWVRTYLEVEILANHQGQVVRAKSENDVLTSEQKEMIRLADPNSEIIVKIQYIPENTLKNNTPKEMDFSFRVMPKNTASFPGGREALKKYIQKNAINKIATEAFEGYDVTAVNFTINTSGEIVNAHIFDSAFQPFDNDEINQLLLTTIQKMPCWKPAEYSNGAKVNQDFVLTVGNMKSCVVNLMNIKKWD